MQKLGSIMVKEKTIVTVLELPELNNSTVCQHRKPVRKWKLQLSGVPTFTEISKVSKVFFKQIACVFVPFIKKKT